MANCWSCRITVTALLVSISCISSSLAFPSLSFIRRHGSSLASKQHSSLDVAAITSEPILGPSSPSDPTQFDVACVANPVVLPPNDDNDKWQCYYYGNAGSWCDDIKSFLPTGWCGLAESDDGIHWTKVPGSLEGGAILAPEGGQDAWDAVQIGVGDVVRVRPGELHMYYFGGSAEHLKMGPFDSITGFRMRIGRAKSLDGGRTWEKMGVVLDYDESEGVFASWPRILMPKKEGQPWKMLYHAFNGTKWRVFSAESDDEGESWTRTGMVLEGGQDEDCFDFSGIGTRAVTTWGNGILMVYEGVDAKSIHRFGAAYCEDGASEWKKLESGKPILEPGKGPLGEWASQVIGTPYLVSMPDESIRLYHCAKRGPEAKMSIGVLVSVSGDVSPSAWKAVGATVEA